MTNKALRILIADEQHFHRLKTERLFNQLGYYRVAPVHSLVQMLTLVEYGCEPFDLGGHQCLIGGWGVGPAWVLPR